MTYAMFPPRLPLPRRLYHYCSTITMHSIVKNKSIWLSSLNLSNDSSEGMMIRHSLEEMSDKEGMGLVFKTNIRTWYSILFEDAVHALGFCVSEEGDLLSQWRGYGADGAGVSIGFNKSCIEALAVPRNSAASRELYFQKMRYELVPETSKVQQLYETIKATFLSMLGAPLGEMSPESMTELVVATLPGRESLKLFSELLRHAYFTKSKAFSEEQEWRLLTYYEHLVVGSECDYRATVDKLIPYVNIPFNMTGHDPILEVVLGPKNKTPISVMKDYLSDSGFYQVTVTKSQCSYR